MSTKSKSQQIPNSSPTINTNTKDDERNTTLSLSSLNQYLSQSTINYESHKIPNLFPNFSTAASILRTLRPYLLPHPYNTSRLYLRTSLPYETAKSNISSFFSLLATVEKHLATTRSSPPPPYQPILYIIEGLDGSGKSTLVQNLSHALQGNNVIAVGTPPSSLSFVRDIFDAYGSPANRAYYMISNYVLAYEVMQECTKRRDHVVFVVDRFYTSTCSYTLGKKHEEDGTTTTTTSSSSSSDYDGLLQWPSDLLKPTKVLRIDVNDDERARRMDSRGFDNDAINPWDAYLRKHPSVGRRIMSLVESICRCNDIDFECLDGHISPEGLTIQAVEAVTRSGLGRMANEMMSCSSGREGPLTQMVSFAADLKLCDGNNGRRRRHAPWFMQIATTPSSSCNDGGGAAAPPLLRSVGIHSVDDAGIVFHASCYFGREGTMTSLVNNENDGDDNDKIKCPSLVAAPTHSVALPASFVWVGDSYPYERQWRGEGWVSPLTLLPHNKNNNTPHDDNNNNSSMSSFYVAPSNLTRTMAESNLPPPIAYRLYIRRCEVLLGGPSSPCGGPRKIEWVRFFNSLMWSHPRSIPLYSSPSTWSNRQLSLSRRQQPRPMTLVLFGPHTSGKRTIGRLLASRWNWDFHTEIGDDLRTEADLKCPNGHRCGGYGKDWDDIVYTAEERRDEEYNNNQSARCEDTHDDNNNDDDDVNDGTTSGSGNRIVETWHMGNLGWALQRIINDDNDNDNNDINKTKKQQQQQQWIKRTSHAIEKESTKSLTLFVHLRISAKTMLRRRQNSNVSILPFTEGTHKDEAGRLQWHLGGRLATLMKKEEGFRVVRETVPCLEVRNDEDGEEEMERVMRRIMAFVEYFRFVGVERR